MCNHHLYTFDGWGKIPESGFISLTTLVTLVAAGGIGITLSQRYFHKIPNWWHARLYVLLLIAVLIAMLW